MINKRNLFISLICLTLLVVLLNVFLVKEPEIENLPEITLPENQKTADNVQFKFVGEIPSIEKEVKIYNNLSEGTISEEKIIEIGKSFGFNVEPQLTETTLGDIYKFKNDSALLTINKNSTEINYLRISDESEEFVIKGSDNLEQIAKDFLKELKIFDQQFSFKSTGDVKSFLKNEDKGTLINSGLNEANRFALELDILVDNKKLISKLTQDVPMTITIDQSGKVVGFTSDLLFLDKFNVEGKIELAPVEQAIKAINEGQGQISVIRNKNELGYEDYVFVELGDIKTSELTELELIYIYDQSIHQLQPYYKFSGSAVKKNGFPLLIEVLITAVPQDIFRK